MRTSQSSPEAHNDPVTLATPVMKPSGLPQSFSAQTLPTVTSPGYNGPGSKHSEPKNWAPGKPMLEGPPPKFNLPASTSMQLIPRHRASASTSTVGSDPFYGDSSSYFVAQSPSRHVVSAQMNVANNRVSRSAQLTHLTATPSGLPSFTVAMDPNNFPFVDSARQHKPTNHGVVKIRNIPFSSKRSEIIAFLGRTAKILSDQEEPVHIIMERVTSKTMDAFVEFETLDDAMRAVERHRFNLANGRVSRLGDRPVEVEVASQGALMADLFPITRGVEWDGVTPKFKPMNSNEPWENFKGFVSEEEMTMLIKHVEVPHRSPFSKECPQRPYECLISTLKKLPWGFTDRITISQRRAIYKATCELLRLLARSVLRKDDQLNLTSQLQRRLISAAMNCPGFTPVMKDDIAWLVQMEEDQMRLFNQPFNAQAWRHQYALAPKPGIPGDVLEWYIALIREQTSRDIIARPLAYRTEVQEKTRDTDMHWGYFWAEIDYKQGPEFDQMTLAVAADLELLAVERILARALPHH